MGLETLLEATVIQYVIANNVKPQYAGKQRIKDYMKARRWLYLATGVEVLSWERAVTQQEKQLSNN